MVTDVRKKHEVIKRTGTTVYTGTDIVRWQQPPEPSAAVTVCVSRVTVFRQISMLERWIASWLKKCDRCQFCCFWGLGNELLHRVRLHIELLHTSQVRWAYLSSSRRWIVKLDDSTCLRKPFKTLWRRSVKRNSVSSLHLCPTVVFFVFYLHISLFPAHP